MCLLYLYFYLYIYRLNNMFQMCTHIQVGRMIAFLDMATVEWQLSEHAFNRLRRSHLRGMKIYLYIYLYIYVYLCMSLCVIVCCVSMLCLLCMRLYQCLSMCGHTGVFQELNQLIRLPGLSLGSSLLSPTLSSPRSLRASSFSTGGAGSENNAQNQHKYHIFHNLVACLDILETVIYLRPCSLALSGTKSNKNNDAGTSHGNGRIGGKRAFSSVPNISHTTASRTSPGSMSSISEAIPEGGKKLDFDKIIEEGSENRSEGSENVKMRKVVGSEPFVFSARRMTEDWPVSVALRALPTP